MSEPELTVEERRIIAIHEAGHAVVLVVHNLDFEGIEVGEGNGTLAEIEQDLQREIGRESELGPNFERDEAERLRKIEGNILSCYTGQAAEKRWTGEDNPDGAELDEYQAEQLAEYAFDINLFERSDKVTQRYLRSFQEEATRFVQEPQNWAAIEAVADELMNVDWLSADQVRRIVDELSLKT